MSDQNNIKLVLEGPTEGDEDDIIYTFLHIESLEIPERPHFPQETLNKLVNYCSSYASNQYVCYDDIKRVEQGGEVVPHEEYVLVNSVSLFGEPFAVLLKQDGDEWEVVAVEAGQFTSADDFTNLSGGEKGQKILEKIQSFVDDPDSYSNIHVIYPYKPGRVYPF
ncbi:MAG TPA: hypothetical protein VKK79_03380 [Candidatus Lokiarchaeia archaeon]|nr:hypothetical protein [Candidatus Lokiarchaeia archaeon]